jgi:hypothetical protein
MLSSAMLQSGIPSNAASCRCLKSFYTTSSVNRIQKIRFTISSNSCIFVLLRSTGKCFCFCFCASQVSNKPLHSLQYLKNTFTFLAKNIYKMSLTVFVPKCKNEMELLRKSFLEDFSSHERLLANWFELDSYAKILEERVDTLFENAIFNFFTANNY